MVKKTNPRLEEVCQSAISVLYCVGYTIDLHIRKGAGASILNLQPGLPRYEWPGYGGVDYASIDVMAGLEAVYRYGIHGELRGFVSDDEDGNLGRLEALLEMVFNEVFDRNWSDVKDLLGEHDHGELLRRVVMLAKARYQLDNERCVSLVNIALLADMNERSVRNALHATGDGLLVATRDEAGELVVEKTEALRWLRGTQSFKETERIGSFLEKLPDMLERDEIMPFLQERLKQRFPTDSLKAVLEVSDDEAETSMYDNAGSSVGLNGEYARRLFCQDIAQLSPEDCPIISEILVMDTQWLITQVMRAKFPEAMKQIEPTRPVTPALRFSPFNEEAGTLDVVLTSAGIRNGYFDIESRYADRLFPSDSFGGRGGDEKAAEIALYHDQKKSPYRTDLRVKSKALVSPRKRFSAYFTAHSAKAGDVIRIKRTGDRSYELVYVGQ